MQPDVEASIEVLRAFNRWLDDDWGFAYQDRIFGVPFLTLSDLDSAVAELDWCLSRGARVITIRNGPVFTREGLRSPADPDFDAFWARVEESGIVVTTHAGFEDGYTDVASDIARTWGLVGPPAGELRPDASAVQSASLVAQLMKHRLIEDFATVLVAHKLFERFPRLRVAYIENGADWVPRCLHSLHMLGGQNPGMFASDPAEQFREHCWVAPFVEDSVEELARYMPVETNPLWIGLATCRGPVATTRLLFECGLVLARRPAQDHGGKCLVVDLRPRGARSSLKSNCSFIYKGYVVLP